MEIELDKSEHESLPEISISGNIKELIYTVYSKDTKGITLLNKAFKNREDAYSYAVLKIKQLLDIIQNEFKIGKEKIQPLYATLIQITFNQTYDVIKQYDYFKDNFTNYFNFVKREPIMFFVATLELL